MQGDDSEAAATKGGTSKPQRSAGPMTIQQVVGGSVAPPSNHLGVRHQNTERVVLVAAMNREANTALELVACPTEAAAYEQFEPEVTVELVDGTGAREPIRIRYERVTDFDREALLDRVEPLRARLLRAEVLRYLVDQIRQSPRLRTHLSASRELVLRALADRRATIDELLGRST